MKKLFYLLLALPLFGVPGGLGNDLGGMKIYKARLPIYHKKHLQFMIFCAEMTRKADKIYADNAVIDLIKKNTDINKIKYFEDVSPYKLGTVPAAVAEFWKDKTASSIGFISSSKAVIQQESRVASGTEKVFFRSPQLDLNGVGFTANFSTRIIKVLNDVNIIIRMKPPTPSTPADTRDIVKVRADSMVMDMQKELVTLNGNIKVNDAGFDIFCSALLLDLKKKNEAKPAAGGNNKQADSDNALDPSGVSQITCIGNVKIIRKLSAAEQQKGGTQEALADKAVYNTVNEEITLTGKKPSIRRGSDMISGRKIVIWKNSERLKAWKDCLVEITDPKAKTPRKTEITSDFIDFDYAGNLGIFTGHVRVKNADVRLHCNEMTIYLQDRGSKRKDIVKSLMASSGRKDLREIVCTGNVIIRRNQINTSKDERAHAGRAVYVLKDNKVILSGNNPFIISGRDSVSGKLMHIWLDQNRLKILKDSKITLDENSAQGKTLIESVSSDLNYGGNELAFSGEVRVRNPKINLACENMKIYLDEPVKTAKTTAAAETGTSDSSLLTPGSGSGKDVREIICTGSVRVDDPRAYVNCERMDITFKDIGPGAEKSPLGGLGGDSKREVYLIKCFGKVQMANKPENPEEKPTVITSDQAILNIPGNVGDLLGNVEIEEPRVNLTCDKMKLLARNVSKQQAAANELENHPVDMMPKHISIGDSKELTKIICLDKVVMTRKLPNEVQKACGDKAVYLVNEHNVTLTCNGENRKPTLQRGPTVMEGSKVILWTDSEKLEIENGTLKNFDPSGL
ncbi:MAG: LptA/OstA family protein [Victivallales bacterium]|nr:LptA/OstA family protein [Victivallales bacterium]